MAFREPSPRRYRIQMVAVLASLWIAAPLSAQVVHGRVLDGTTGIGADGVNVALIDADGAIHGTTISDSGGNFQLPAPRPGSYRLRAERIGYAPATTDVFAIAENELVELRIQLSVEPVALAPLTITERRRYRSGSLEAYYRRLELYGRPGFGHFVTREMIEERGYARISDYLRRVPGISIRHDRSSEAWINMRRAGQDCRPKIYLDGLDLTHAVTPLDKMVRPGDIEGVEVYRGPETPGEFHDPNNCGVLLAWTRQDRPDRPWSWKRFLIGGAGLLTIGYLVFH